MGDTSEYKALGSFGYKISLLHICLKMKFAFILILVLPYLSVHGQYEPYIKSDKQWLYDYDCFGPCQGFYGATIKYYYDGDTLIDAKNYQKLIGEILGYHEPTWGFRESPYLAGLLREDTIEKKVYMFYGLDVYSNSPNYMTEKVLFDFSLEVGDTLRSEPTFCSPARTFSVSQVDTFHLINGIVVKKYLYQNYGVFQIDAIGSQYIEIDPIWCNPVYVFSLRCIMDNGVLIYGWYCSPLAVDQIENIDTYFKIYPQPVADNLTISSELNEATVDLFDSTGKFILRKSLHYGENQIDCSGWCSGIYCYQLISGVNHWSGKFLKID